uniref:Transmembrane protein 238a n=1 Tax=Sinocyclocheilus grahami TaxID=75366 RepID=A0A672NK07_SINGR
MALRCIGSCLPLFVMAIVFDILGVVLLFVGIFGNVRMHGVFYGDFLIHTGALVLFASLALWLMWYVGNIRVKDEDFRPSAAHSVKELARKLTERLSKTHLKDNTGEKRFIV